MARRSLLLPCWPPGPGRPLGGSVLPGECSRRLLCGAGHPRGCGEGLAPRGAGLPCAGDPALLAAAATGAAPAPTLPDKQSQRNSCPCNLCPILSFVAFLAGEGSVGKGIPHSGRLRGRSGDVSAGRLWLQPCWGGVVPGQTPSSSRAGQSPVPGSRESLRQGRARLLVQRSSAWECTDPPAGGLARL